MVLRSEAEDVKEETLGLQLNQTLLLVLQKNTEHGQNYSLAWPMGRIAVALGVVGGMKAVTWTRDAKAVRPMATSLTGIVIGKRTKRVGTRSTAAAVDG